MKPVFFFVVVTVHVCILCCYERLAAAQSGRIPFTPRQIKSLSSVCGCPLRAACNALLLCPALPDHALQTMPHCDESESAGSQGRFAAGACSQSKVTGRGSVELCCRWLDSSTKKSESCCVLLAPVSLVLGPLHRHSLCNSSGLVAGLTTHTLLLDCPRLRPDRPRTCTA